MQIIFENKDERSISEKTDPIDIIICIESIS